MDNFRYFLMFLIFMISCAQYEAALAEGEYVVRKDTTDRCYICIGSEWVEGNCARIKCSGGNTSFFPDGNDRIRTRFISKSELLAGCGEGAWKRSSGKYSPTWITNVQKETVNLKDL
ncbi:hypothetical protein Ddc_18286 [Ditylenchus destructor]|nr:hypothetical protein Ddc_18286 [Ditylenchus destructor]